MYCYCCLSFVVRFLQNRCSCRSNCDFVLMQLSREWRCDACALSGPCNSLANSSIGPSVGCCWRCLSVLLVLVAIRSDLIELRQRFVSQLNCELTRTFCSLPVSCLDCSVYYNSFASVQFSFLHFSPVSFVSFMPLAS